MLHVFFGNDTSKTREAALAFLSSTMSAGENYDRLDTDSYTAGILADIAGASSLFGNGGFYLLDTPSVQKDFFADVLENLALLSESKNIFVIIEGPLLAPEKKKFSKFATTIEEYKKTSERYNVFGLTDCLLKKDKRALWVGLQEAKHAGLSAEEVIGTLWWQLKSLRLAKLATTADEAGMKDYPFKKAKQALRNFKDNEAEELSERLLTLYHDGHGGRLDIDMALEKWALTL